MYLSVPLISLLCLCDVLEYSVEIWVDEGPYDVDILLDGTPSVSTIPIHMSKTLPVPFNISISTYGTSVHTLCFK